MKHFHIKMFCLSMKLGKKISCCSINIQHLKPMGKTGTMKGIIRMITTTKKSKQKEKKILSKNQ